MNRNQAKLIARIAYHIKDVPRCNEGHGVSPADRVNKESSKTPCCFFANGVRAGLINEELAWNLQYPNSLKEYLKVPFSDAHSLIFPSLRSNAEISGRDYYNSARKFLRKYNFEDELLRLHHAGIV